MLFFLVMLRRPPVSTRTDPRVPATTLVRSEAPRPKGARGPAGARNIALAPLGSFAKRHDRHREAAKRSWRSKTAGETGESLDCRAPAGLAMTMEAVCNTPRRGEGGERGSSLSARARSCGAVLHHLHEAVE